MPRPRRRTASVLFLTLLAWSVALPQETRFAVITDTHIGAGGAAAELEAIVARINRMKEVEFVIHTGDITEKGRDSEFSEAKKILDGLHCPYSIIPGNHDSHWIGYGLAGFRKTWGDDKFLFQKGGSFFVGLNAWDLGHVAPQDLRWIEQRVLEMPPSATIFLFIHNPLSSIDNWFALSNILRGCRAFVISGHVHRSEEVTYNGIPGATIRAAISSQKAGWGFAVVRDTLEDIDFYEVGETGGPDLWGIISKAQSREIPEIHRTLFENFGAEILWMNDLKIRLPAPLAVWNDFLYSADHSGMITCFDLKGKILWRFEGKLPFVSRPAVVDGMLWAAAANGRIFKLDAKTGKRLNSSEIKDDAQSQLVVFSNHDGRKRALLVGTRSGKMMRLDADSLTEIWTNKDAAGAIQTRPLVIGGKVIYGSWDGRLRCLDETSGRLLWSWTENYNFYYSPAGCVPQTDGRHVFVCAPDGYVSSVDLSSGQTQWRKKYSCWESIGISEDGKRILVKGRVDEFDILEAESGSLVHKIVPSHGIGDIMAAEPIEWKGSVIFGAQNGFVYRIDHNGQISPLLFLGAAGIHTIQHIKDNLFAASNLDGRIAVFKIPSSD